MGRKRSFRTWSTGDEERLAELVREVEDALARGRGDQAAREVVPQWAGCETITELAERAGVDRASMSVCLAAQPESPYWKIRAELDRCLKLPPGGMTRVLSMVEAVALAAVS